MRWETINIIPFLHRFFYKRKAARPVDVPEDSSEDEFDVNEHDDELFEPDNKSTSDASSDIESNGSEDSELNIPLSDLAAATASTSKEKPVFQWKANKENLATPQQAKFDDKKLRINPAVVQKQFTSSTAPIDFFWLFMEDCLDDIVFQTNLYNVQKAQAGEPNCPKPVTKEDIVKVLGISLYMGVVKLPNRRMYWSPKTRIDAVAETMPRNRFDDILRILHFNDNSKQKGIGEEGYNKLFKIQPITDHLRGKFKGVVLPETYHAIDEMMIAFKGHHSLKMYMPKKPTKWGYKLWVRAGVSGYVYDFEISGGNTKGPPDGVQVSPALGESEFVVLRLVHDLPPYSHKIFFDNYFASPELLVHLHGTGHYAVCTLRANRTRKCPLKNEKQLKKEGRGAIDYRINKDENIIVCAWFDNKQVLTASNYIGVHPISDCKRYNRKEKKDIMVDRPAIVATYNQFMGGVDKADMMLSFYKTKLKTTKWYLRIFFHLVNMCVVNAWVIYREAGGKGPLLDFLVDIARTLLTGTATADPTIDDNPVPTPPVRSLSASQVPLGIRNDRTNHWPFQVTGIPQRCKGEGCSRKTRFICSKCQVYLCVVGKRCFIEFHGVYFRAC